MNVVSLSGNWKKAIRLETVNLSIREIGLNDTKLLLNFVHKNLERIRAVSPTYDQSVAEPDIREHIKFCLNKRPKKSVTLLCFQKYASTDRILATAEIDPTQKEGWLELGIMPGSDCAINHAAEALNALSDKLISDRIVRHGVCAYPLEDDRQGRMICEWADFSFRSIEKRALPAFAGEFSRLHAVYERACP